MSAELEIYYHDHVVAAYVEYKTTSKGRYYGQRKDLRKAVEAASALFHFREHLPPSLALTRAEAERRCHDYGLLGDVVNSAKHHLIGNMTPHGQPLVDDMKNITEQKVCITYQDSDGEYAMSLKVVFVKLTNGAERLLLDVLTNVLNFWEHYLCAGGVLGTVRKFQCDDPFRWRSRAECGSTSDGIRVTKGHHAQILFRFMRYDEKVGRAVPVDLTGANLTFTVRKPPRLDVVVHAVRNVDKHVLERTVKLSDQESQAVAQCRTEKAKQNVLSRMPGIRKALAELAAETKATGASSVVAGKDQTDRDQNNGSSRFPP